MTGMDTQEHQIDLGHLMAFDPLHHFPSPPTSREELVKECLQKGTVLVQLIADALFNLPSTEDIDGPLVKLPPPMREFSITIFLKMHPKTLQLTMACATQEC